MRKYIYMKIHYLTFGQGQGNVAQYRLDLHCLPMSHKKDAKLICIKRMPQVNVKMNHIPVDKKMACFHHFFYYNGIVVSVYPIIMKGQTIIICFEF